MDPQKKKYTKIYISNNFIFSEKKKTFQGNKQRIREKRDYLDCLNGIFHLKQPPFWRKCVHSSVILGPSQIPKPKKLNKKNLISN